MRLMLLRPRSHVPVFARPGDNWPGKSTTWSFKTSPVLSSRACTVICKDRNSIIALYLLHRRRKRRRDRLHWVHPIIQRGEEFGAFYTLFGELRNDANKFSNYFRMSVSSFDEMHRRLKKSIQCRNSKMRNCIQPVEMLAVTVR